MGQQGRRDRIAGAWADQYRDRWKWDKTGYGTHCVDCFPSNCAYRVYVRNGRAVCEEPTANYETIEKGVPDMNPTGCQKGASWTQMLHAPDRLTHPLRRAGARGEGRWEQISWDEAMTDIADAMLDAIEESGPESIVRIGTPHGGMQSFILANATLERLGATMTDINSEINDFDPGLYLTFGRFNPAPTFDDWFHSKLILIWTNNPVYSAIPAYHYIAEARYNGSEVVTIAPDYSPSAVHSDQFVPVRIGSDAALALSMCRVLIDEGLVNEAFVREQTDLGLLVRTDTHRFLRQSDVRTGGSDSVFHLFDTQGGRIVEAPRTLALGDLVPALDGRYTAALADGSEVEVVPVFVRLRERLADYAPESAAAICGVHPDVIRDLARKAARSVTRIFLGWTTGKSYHGDLMERSMALLLALTGNWGKKGAGTRCWSIGMFDGGFMYPFKTRPGRDEIRRLDTEQRAKMAAIRATDPTLTDEMILGEMAYTDSSIRGTPSAFFWYHHCGYQEAWNKADWHDPSMRRSFDEYANEAIDKGWWRGVIRPAKDKPPRVLFEIGGNLLRRQRGGQRMLLEHLWPKLKMIVSVDVRMTTTGLYSDIVLPAAQHYEKTNFPYTVTDTMMLVLSDRVVEPAGESRSEWQFNNLLAKKISERAAARGLTEIARPDGTRVRLDTLWEDITFNGAMADDDAVFDEMVRDTAVLGTVPPETTLATLRENKGWVRFSGWGNSTLALSQASDLKPDETHSPWRWQTEKKEPFPTLTRRAQFYIDHEWFLEAGEELPLHKEAPCMGGNHPFQVTSGHPRSSVNATNITSRIMQATTRGVPVVHINDTDAAARGIEDGTDVRVFNDVATMVLQARVTPAVQPGQLIIYNGWEPFQFKDWQDFSNLETGMVKYLHLAGGYGHLRYRTTHWQPVPIDRGVHVDIAPVAK